MFQDIANKITTHIVGFLEGGIATNLNGNIGAGIKNESHECSIAGLHSADERRAAFSNSIHVRTFVQEFLHLIELLVADGMKK